MKKLIALLIATSCIVSCTKERSCFHCVVYKDHEASKIAFFVDYCKVLPDDVHITDTLYDGLPVACYAK